VGEVDQLQDPVDERVAERDESVDGAVTDAYEGNGEEVARGFDEIDRKPQSDERKKTQPDDRDDARAQPGKEESER
jgi:hypothetical protein